MKKEREFIVEWTYKSTTTAVVLATSKREAKLKAMDGKYESVGTTGYEPLWSTCQIYSGAKP